MATHRTEHRVRFHELDPYDHVNHAIYVTYFEIGRVDALETIGLGLDVLKGQGYQFVITKIDVRFRRSAGAGDVLNIYTSVASSGRASTVWHQEIRQCEPARPVSSEAVPGTKEAIGARHVLGELIATAEVKVAVTGSDGKPTRPPAELFETLRQLAT